MLTYTCQLSSHKKAKSPYRYLKGISLSFVEFEDFPFKSDKISKYLKLT